MIDQVLRVKREDFGDWLALRQKLWPLPRKVHARDQRRLFGKRGFVCLIAWEADEAIGFAEATIRPFANGCDSSPVPFLEGIYVKPAHRKKGVGNSLVKAISSWATRRGFQELGSDAYLSDHLSHSFHRSIGFAETERVVYFRMKLKRKSKKLER